MQVRFNVYSSLGPCQHSHLAQIFAVWKDSIYLTGMDQVHLEEKNVPNKVIRAIAVEDV